VTGRSTGLVYSLPCSSALSLSHATSQTVIADVFEVVVGAAGFVAGHAAQAPVDGLALEAGTGRLDFGDDVTPCKLGRARALMQFMDGVQDGVSAAQAAVSKLGL
jgi:hypothetical protein